MSELSDIGNPNLNQKRLLAITNGVHHIISVAEAATILNLPTRVVAKLMARWAETGSLSRIKRGFYLTALPKPSIIDVSPVEPWVIAEDIFRPCYIGGLSAAKHWGLTENIFHTNRVFTIQKPRSRHQTINGVNFLLRTISKEALFGLLPVWKEQCRVQISDPSRTITDFLVDPKLGGGIHNVTDMFIKYLKSEYRNIDLLLDYAKRLQIGAVLKRLGYLLERHDPCECGTVSFCKILMSTCSVKLDPQLKADRLITRWGLWVPKEWD